MSESFWNRTANTYDEDIQQHGEHYDKSITATLEQLKPADVVLDFGCASGEHALEIAPYVEQVHGIDISTTMIDLANQKARDRNIINATFQRLDVFDDGLQGGSFSAVVAFHVFHLVPSAEDTLRRLNSLLADDGRLISQNAMSRQSWSYCSCRL